MKILVVEDEEGLRRSMVDFLKEESYLCEQASSLVKASEKLDIYEYDCLLVDIGLPDGNGLSLIKEFKHRQPQMGIIVVSARNSLEDKVTGLDLGADDYLAKPFHLTELNSRIHSVLRRIKFGGKKEMVVAALHIFPESRQVFVEDKPVPLTRKEFDLLIFFVSNPGRVLTKESIAEHLWGDFADASDSFDFVYSHIKNLRHKLQSKSGVDYFQNVYGSGYAFNAAREQ